VAAVFLLLAPSVALAANWPFNNRRHYWIARDYVANIFRSLEPRSLLLTFDWEVASPMFYAQQVARRRRDVKVVDINLLRRSWYFDYLKRVYPELIARSAASVDAFVTELKLWEQDESAYANKQAAERINSRFEEMITSFVKEEMRVAPVFMTLDFLAPSEGDRRLTDSIMQQYAPVPQGLLFKLTNDPNAFQNPHLIQMELGGLNDGTLRFEEDDVVKTKVFPVYTAMIVNRGRYLARFGYHQQAIVAYKEALALEPQLETAKRGLEESTAQLPAK
jgi:tetratricopeptide (TPR) repeat protein